MVAWQLQVGDPARLAVSIAFSANPEGDHDAATVEEGLSWGSLRLWIDGENLCAHHELGQIVEDCHWYLLPLLEWFADNWNALTHEERPPLQNSGVSAAEALAKSKQPPLSLKDVDEFGWMADWAAWWQRHNLRAARQGGVLPDVYIRRYRDQLEFSVGAEALPGVPREYSFLVRNRMYRLQVEEVTNLLHEVLTAATNELRRRLPESGRFLALKAKLQDLTDADGHRLRRLALLSGFREDEEGFEALAAAVDQAFVGVDDDISASILSSQRDSRLALVGSPYARLLYGALSPTTEAADVLILAAALLANYQPRPTSDSLEAPKNALLEAAADVANLSPGRQGSDLGELACELLGSPENNWVDVEGVLARLEIRVEALGLSDSHLRAVSVFGPTQPPAVYTNSGFAWGTAAHVTRMTLAHELCHLLIDRELGDELSVASGPWAPAGIEQRANAFAAAFLLPTWLLRDAIAAHDSNMTSRQDLQTLCDQFRVGIGTLVDRLFTLGELTSDERFRLQADMGRRRAVRRT